MGGSECSDDLCVVDVRALGRHACLCNDEVVDDLPGGVMVKGYVMVDESTLSTIGVLRYTALDAEDEGRAQSISGKIGRVPSFGSSFLVMER